MAVSYPGFYKRGTIDTMSGAPGDVDQPTVAQKAFFGVKDCHFARFQIRIVLEMQYFGVDGIGDASAVADDEAGVLRDDFHGRKVHRYLEDDALDDRFGCRVDSNF